MDIKEFLQKLDSYNCRIPLSSLDVLMNRLEVNLNDIDPKCVKFSDERYQRNFLHAGPFYHALILCWKSGQRSPIHDHTGSTCGVKVLNGSGIETVFNKTKDGYLYATKSINLEFGQVVGSQDSDVHQVSNLGSLPFVTLHVYSPPLMDMQVYDIESNDVAPFFDPISLTAGAGI